jgi:RNA polymerase sigma-70 factor (ECF subfamily)
MMPSGDRRWREHGLRSAVLAGDEAAWQTWYDETFPGLYAFVRWRCAGLTDWTDDVVQETWLTAIHRIRAFDPDQGSFADWLRGIAANLLRNQMRKHRPLPSLNGRPQTSEHAASAAESDEHGRREQAEQIAHALSRLPQRYEAALRAKYLDQQSVAHMAEAWNESPKAIESLLTRAREAFRQEYQRLESDQNPEHQRAGSTMKSDQSPER